MSKITFPALYTLALNLREISLYVYVRTYIYIYRKREREREREIGRMSVRARET